MADMAKLVARTFDRKPEIRFNSTPRDLSPRNNSVRPADRKQCPWPERWNQPWIGEAKSGASEPCEIDRRPTAVCSRPRFGRGPRQRSNPEVLKVAGFN